MLSSTQSPRQDAEGCTWFPSPRLARFRFLHHVFGLLCVLNIEGWYVTYVRYVRGLGLLRIESGQRYSASGKTTGSRVSAQVFDPGSSAFCQTVG